MTQKLRYLLFIGLPFLIAGAFCFMIGVMRLKVSELGGWDFRDTFNFVVGGLMAALVGAFVERVTRKGADSGEPKQ